MHLSCAYTCTICMTWADIIRGAGRQYQLPKSGHGFSSGLAVAAQKSMQWARGVELELEEALKMGPVWPVERVARVR